MTWKNCPTYSSCYRGFCKCADELKGDGENCKPGKKNLSHDVNYRIQVRKYKDRLRAIANAMCIGKAWPLIAVAACNETVRHKYFTIFKSSLLTSKTGAPHVETNETPR